MPRVHFSRPSCFGVVIAALVLAAVIIGSFLLVRNSPLVAVNEVKIVGLSGYYERDARAAVVAEATQMTTMNFDAARVQEAASEFVDVAGVRVETDFPHGATIHVDVRRPVLVARLNGRTVTLSQSGEVIESPKSIAGLPQIEASSPLVGNRVTGGKALEAATVLGAAPDVLLRKVDTVRWGRLGIVVALEKGPDLYFGDAEDARRKWRDAAAVLASTQARGAAYLDLRIVGRPAVGGLGGAPKAEATEISSMHGATTTAAPTAAAAPTQVPATQPQAPVVTQPQQAPATQAPAAPAPAPAPVQTGGAGAGN